MQQKLAQKEKASKEEHLRILAQRAREERGGIVPSVASKPSVEGRTAMNTSLAAYGSDSGNGSEDEDSAEDEDARKVRDEMRQEKRHEREREMRMSNMGTEQRAKQLARSVLSFEASFIHSIWIIQTTTPRYFGENCSWSG